LACTEGPPALALAINEVLVGRIDEGPEAVAKEKRGPLRLRNPSGIAGRSVPDEVVLQTAVEVVRIGRVCADMVELADRQRGHEAPAGAAIGRVIDAAVGSDQDLFVVLRVDPDRVDVSVVRAAQAAPALAGVIRDVEIEGRLVDPVHVFRVRRHVGEVEGTAGDGARGRLTGPGLSLVGRAVEARVYGAGDLWIATGLDGGVHHVRIGGRDGHRDAAEVPGGEPLRDFAPRCAAVARLVEAAARSAGGEEVRLAPELPHPRVE